MARIIAQCLVVLLVAACGADASPGPTRDESGILVLPASPPVVGCPIDVPPIVGRLVTDRDAGVAIDTGAERVAIVWPTGYHAREVASVVEVLNGDDLVVARVGGTIRLQGVGVDGRWLASPCQSPLGPPASA